VLTDDAPAYLELLREDGVVRLPGVFPLDVLAAMRCAAQACFNAAEGGGARAFPERFRYNPLSRSILLAALEDFGCSTGQLFAPLAIAGLEALLAGALGEAAAYHPEEAWVRKRYAPFHAPAGYYPNSWHQDGGLGVSFPPHSGPAIPMTRLLTCWLPLDPCAGDRPVLEFVRRRLDRLLHYTELDDPNLRQRFAPEEFWAPELQPGDGLIFLNGTLHRTYVQPEMREDRLSVEYRFFPAGAPGGKG
jgi:hypothetical protein